MSKSDIMGGCNRVMLSAFTLKPQGFLTICWKGCRFPGKKGGSFHKVLSSLWRRFAEYLLNTSYVLSCIWCIYIHSNGFLVIFVKKEWRASFLSFQVPMAGGGQWCYLPCPYSESLSTASDHRRRQRIYLPVRRPCASCWELLWPASDQAASRNHDKAQGNFWACTTSV